MAFTQVDLANAYALMTMLIDLVQLRTFVAVAEEQHLTRAAERLYISQSGASAHIRAIEENLGVQLFERTNRSLELTRAGHVLLRQAKKLLGEEAEFTSVAREMRGKIEGDIIVGASSDPAGSRIGQVVRELRAMHPLITVDLRAQTSTGTRQALKTGELDIGMLLSRPADIGFTYYQLATVNFRVAGPAAWKAKIEAADWAELAAMPWVTSTKRSLAYSAMLSELFSDKGLEPNTVVRFDNSALGRQMATEGVGMVLMREEHALQGQREGSLALSPIAQAEFPLLVAHLAKRASDPLINAFVNACSEAWPDMRRTATKAAPDTVRSR